MKTAIAISPLKSGFSPLFFSGETEYGIKTAKELGFDGVELSLKKPSAIDLDSILRELKRTGLAVPTIATGQSYVEDGLYFCAENAAIRDQVVDRIKEIIDFAAQVGSNVTIGGIRGKSSQPIGPQLLDLIKESVYKCCVYAAKFGVGIIIEPVNHYEVSCLFTLKEAVEFIKDLNHPSLSVLYDSYHVNMEESSIIEPLLTAEQFLSHVHFADNNRLVPGYGCFNFTEVVRVLKQINYSGYICIEALPKPDSLTAAKQAIRYLHSLLS